MSPVSNLHNRLTYVHCWLLYIYRRCIASLLTIQWQTYWLIHCFGVEGLYPLKQDVNEQCCSFKQLGEQLKDRCFDRRACMYVCQLHTEFPGRTSTIPSPLHTPFEAVVYGSFTLFLNPQMQFMSHQLANWSRLFTFPFPFIPWIQVHVSCPLDHWVKVCNVYVLCYTLYSTYCEIHIHI